MKDKVIVEERMKEFNKDVLHWKSYDYVVINDKLEDCFNEICSLIKSKKNEIKDNYSSSFIEEHVNKLIS